MLLSPLHVSLRNEFPGNPGGMCGPNSKSRIGGYRTLVENGRTCADLEERRDHDPSWNQRATPFRFRGRNDLHACGRSPPVRIIISHEFLRWCCNKERSVTLKENLIGGPLQRSLNRFRDGLRWPARARQLWQGIDHDLEETVDERI